MAIVSYRLYCSDCDEETVVKESELDDSPWKVGNIYYHDGLCPRCAQAPRSADSQSASETEPEPKELELEELDNIGAKAAENLREAGYDTVESIAEVSDEELLDVSWVGEKALFSLKEAAKQHEPQKRW
jgi:DNA-directed RNA polymerase alpha subunit